MITVEYADEHMEALMALRLISKQAWPSMSANGIAAHFPHVVHYNVLPDFYDLIPEMCDPAGSDLLDTNLSLSYWQAVLYIAH